MVYAVTYISCYFVGYARDEVLGRNCRFLSGVDTDSSTLYQVSLVVIGSLCDLVIRLWTACTILNLLFIVSQIKESIQTEQACTLRILNYRLKLNYTSNEFRGLNLL